MNRLRDSSSPYLLQHADNPVDWWEWTDEAFTEAARRDAPVFLSVGYSSCHWCHVMAHESFEDASVAALLNEHFVSIKVDREERPDVDSVYMGAVQAMTGHGGWPMSVFLTPGRVPFHAGTYWPREPRGGMPGFRQILEAVVRAWTTDRASITDLGQRLTEHLQQQSSVPTTVAGTGPAPDARLAEQARDGCLQASDREHGGFGRAPKFPQAMTIDFLLAHHLRTGDGASLSAARHALDAMATGGIHDQIAGGFARYSTDEHWLVPHFEKMLYDNALLLRAYTHGWWITGSPRYRFVAERTADWLLDTARTDAGGFVSAFDADSEGVEGRYFVWDLDEFTDVVRGTGEDPKEWANRYGVTAGGNFTLEDTRARVSILHELVPFDFTNGALMAARDRVDTALRRRRADRVPPGTDDKILTSWNALAIEALAEAGIALRRPDYLAAAQGTARFLSEHAAVDGRLQHVVGGARRIAAFAEDVAYLCRALLVLFDADQDAAWLSWARALAADMDERFADADGSYFDTADDAENLLARPKATWDNATPAPSSVMADAHLRLAGLTGDVRHAERADALLRLFAATSLAAPTGHGELLRALERSLDPREVAIVDGDGATEKTGTDSAAAADPSTGRRGAQDAAGRRGEVGAVERGAAGGTAPLVAVFRESWRPGAVLAVGGPQRADDVPLLADRPPVDGRAAAYVCRNFACDRPVTTPEALRELL